MTSPRVLAEMLLPQYQSASSSGLVLLDTKHRVLRTDGRDRRGPSTPSSHPREDGERWCRGRRTVPQPSVGRYPERARMTWRRTRRVAAAGILMGIDVVDHVILRTRATAACARRGCSEGGGAAYFDCFLVLSRRHGPRALLALRSAPRSEASNLQYRRHFRRARAARLGYAISRKREERLAHGGSGSVAGSSRCRESRTPRALAGLACACAG